MCPHFKLFFQIQPPSKAAHGAAGVSVWVGFLARPLFEQIDGIDFDIEELGNVVLCLDSLL